MAESQVIREFLVALGFKTDESALKKFDEGIAKATKTVFGLAAAIEATAVTVAAGVARFASNLEALYFASIKAGSSASNLKAFDRAAQNLGTTAGEALNSVQGLARFLRNNPGGEGLLESLGVQTRDVNGQLRDMTDIMLGLSHTFAQMPYYLANQYAGIFGISEDTLRAMRSGGFDREVERMRKELRNAGFDKATQDAHRFMIGLRDLENQLMSFGVQVYDALSKRLGGGMERITEWLRTNGPLIAARTADILLRLLDVAERIGKVIVWLVDKFVAWDKATDGWSTRLLGLLAVLKFFGGAEIILGILKLASAFLRLGTGLSAAALGGTGLLGILGQIGLVGAAGAAGYGIGTLIQKALPDSINDKIGEWVAVILSAFRSKTASEALAANDPVMFFRERGWSQEQAAGIVANLKAESGLDPRAVGDHGTALGVAQWHPERQAEFKRVFGHDIRESNLSEQLDYVDYELTRGAERNAGALLKAAHSAQQAAQIVARYYERPAAVDGKAIDRGAAAVQLSQKTDIHVYGNGGRETGRAVASEQDRVNKNLTRHALVAVQ